MANLVPVEIADTTVSRASLHNADEIERLDVREGDVVVVEKAGKIIPKVVRVEKHERRSDLPRWDIPHRMSRSVKPDWSVTRAEFISAVPILPALLN